MKLQRERNIAIARAVINGQTFAAVGKEHAITQERARQIYHHVLRLGVSKELNPEGPRMIGAYRKVRKTRASPEFWHAAISRVAKAWEAKA